jgi:hypothetical protein
LIFKRFAKKAPQDAGLFFARIAAGQLPDNGVSKRSWLMPSTG